MSNASKPIPKGVVEVSETNSGRYTQLVRAGRHMLTADEPESAGGNDNGPGPYDFVLAGLGACTTMTIRMYAERKNIPLEHVSVRLSHQRTHAEDCANCETKEGRLDVITRELSIKGDLDDATRQRLVEIANKCPVSRSLTGTIEVHTSLATQV